MADFYIPLYPEKEFDAVTVGASTAIPVDTFCTHVTPTTGTTCVGTLANGTKVGQLKKIITRAVPSPVATACTISLTSHFADASDIIDMNAIGNYVLCMWQDDNDDASAVNGGGWRVIETGKIDAGVDTLS